MLVPEQCRRANALQRRGMLLKEIAEELGVSFEDIALYLYGGIADWSPIAPPADFSREDDEAELAALEDEEDDDEHADGPDGGDGVEPGAVLSVPEPGGTHADDPPAQVATAALAEPSRNEGSQAPTPEPDRAAKPPHQPAPAPVVDAPQPERRYYLTNGAGEYLRKSGSGMTRNKAEAWVGTAPQMEQAFKAKPTLKDLDPERVPG